MRRLADVVVRWSWAVIGVWVALAIALPLSFPSLGEMAEKHPLVILPSDAPSSVNATKMAEAFQEAGSDNLLVVAFINETGLKPGDEVVYRKVVGALRHDITDVVAVQDFLSTPQLRKFLTSEDKTTWVLPVSLEGELGTPRAFDSYNRVADIIQHQVPKGGSLTVYVTGPAAFARATQTPGSGWKGRIHLPCHMGNHGPQLRTIWGSGSVLFVQDAKLHEGLRGGMEHSYPELYKKHMTYMDDVGT